MLFDAEHGTTPDLIYGRCVTNTPSPESTSFDKQHYTLIIVEIGFCRDLGCDVKLDKKTEKYSPLIVALRRYWGRVEFTAFPIGHAGTILTTGPRPPHRRLLHRPTDRVEITSQQGRLQPRHGPQRQDPRLLSAQVAA